MRLKRDIYFDLTISTLPLFQNGSLCAYIMLVKMRSQKFYACRFLVSLNSNFPIVASSEVRPIIQEYFIRDSIAIIKIDEHCGQVKQAPFC